MDDEEKVGYVLIKGETIPVTCKRDAIGWYVALRKQGSLGAWLTVESAIFEGRPGTADLLKEGERVRLWPKD